VRFVNASASTATGTWDDAPRSKLQWGAPVPSNNLNLLLEQHSHRRTLRVFLGQPWGSGKVPRGERAPEVIPCSPSGALTISRLTSLDTCNTRSRRQSVPITRPRRSATGRHARVKAAKRMQWLGSVGCSWRGAVANGGGSWGGCVDSGSSCGVASKLSSRFFGALAGARFFFGFRPRLLGIVSTALARIN
jgi:hypothetical protein